MPGGGGRQIALGAGRRQRWTPGKAPWRRRAWRRSSLRPGDSPRRFPGARGCSGRHRSDAGAPGRALRRARCDVGGARRWARRDDDEGGSAWNDGDRGLGAERRGHRRHAVTRRGVAEGDFDRSVASSSLRYCSLTPLQRVTWRRNERPDGDGGVSQRATATGKAHCYAKARGRLIRGAAGTARAAGSTTSGGEPPILPLGMEASATN